jgi:hypothetical protein
LRPNENRPTNTHALVPEDAVLTSKWNKPFPVTLLPSAIGAYVAFYFAEKQADRQKQILSEIKAASEHNQTLVDQITSHPK